MRRGGGGRSTGLTGQDRGRRCLGEPRSTAGRAGAGQRSGEVGRRQGDDPLSRGVEVGPKVGSHLEGPATSSEPPAGVDDRAGVRQPQDRTGRAVGDGDHEPMTREVGIGAPCDDLVIRGAPPHGESHGGHIDALRPAGHGVAGRRVHGDHELSVNRKASDRREGPLGGEEPAGITATPCEQGLAASGLERGVPSRWLSSERPEDVGVGNDLVDGPSDLAEAGSDERKLAVLGDQCRSGHAVACEARFVYWSGDRGWLTTLRRRDAGEASGPS